jgi:heme/copper-type cytochrome/quinol oxidase subunit 2
MTRSQIIILSTLGIAVIALIVGGVFYQKSQLMGIEEKEKRGEEVISPREEAKTFGYSPEIPKDVATTTPEIVNTPAAPGTKLSFGMVDLKMTKKGFSPQQIAMKQGNFLKIFVSAQDGDYDFSIPSLSLYTNMKQGESKPVTFTASNSGTFVFECKDSCPSTGRIQGMLVVLP